MTDIRTSLIDAASEELISWEQLCRILLCWISKAEAEEMVDHMPDFEGLLDPPEDED